MEKKIVKPPIRRKPNLSLKLGGGPPSEFSQRSKKKIVAIISKTRTPWATGVTLTNNDLDELEKSLYELQSELANREKDLRMAEMKLIDREYEVSEAEALLKARDQLVEARTKESAAPFTAPTISKETQEALERLKQELDAQEELEERERRLKAAEG